MCTDLFVPDPSSCVQHTSEFVRTLNLIKIPSICRKSVGLAVGGTTVYIYIYIYKSTAYTRLNRLSGKGGKSGMSMLGLLLTRWSECELC